MSADVTLCVLDVDGGAMLERCIDSMRRQTHPVRIIVVDNGSKNPVSARIPGLELIRFETNAGFAAGANAAIRAARTEFVGLINNDVVLAPEWTRRLSSAFDDPRVAAVQSIITRPDGRVDSAGIEVRQGRFVQSGHGMAPGDIRPVHPPWGVAGTAMLLRRDLFIEDAFPEALFAWYEDVDLAARLRAAGWSVALVPEALAVHEGSMTAAILPRRGEGIRVRNRYLVARSRAVGSLPMLFLEDLRRAMGSLLRLRPRLAASIVDGVVRGLGSRKLPELRVRSAPE